MVGVADSDDAGAERGAAAQPVGVAVSVPALLGGADERRQRGERRGRPEDALADDRVLAHEAALAGVEPPRLWRMASGRAILPMSCSSAACSICRVVSSSTPMRRATSEASVATARRCSYRPGSRSCNIFNTVSRVCARSIPRPVLATYIRPSAIRSAPATSGASSGQRAVPDELVIENASPASDSAPSARRSARLGVLTIALDDGESVPAHPVGDPGLHRCRQPSGEPDKQRIAARVTEGVVVALEAVEIEEGERERARVVLGRQAPGEVAHQPPPVAQAGQIVGEREASAALEQLERD